MHGLGQHEYRSDKHPLHDRIEQLEAEVERLKATERFLRSERPMARKLTELEADVETGKRMCGQLMSELGELMDFAFRNTDPMDMTQEDNLLWCNWFSGRVK